MPLPTMFEPNQLTFLRIVLTPIAVFLLLMNNSPAIQMATLVFILASLTDWWDGHVARKYGYVTSWGKIFDPLADKVLVLSMFFSFVLLDMIPLSYVIIIAVRDIIITILRAYMMMYDKPIAANVLAKWKTFSQMGLVYFLFIYINLGQILSPETMTGTLGFMPVFIFRFTQFVAVFTIITGLIYLFQNRRPIADLIWTIVKFIISPVSLILDTKPENGNEKDKQSTTGDSGKNDNKK
ncbi:MAG: CDP-diacylglycerol--glycerol-3-phosphate 3-phosphatidyltransferase [bacterium]|nr:CDP-diacylglycerol--glycerol-3-phosphate 3-phosphatidyltransferase [bacterium]